MRLCEDISLIHFFKAVEACGGEVKFCSRQGDILNLKSTLSQYLFTSLMARKDLLQDGRIVCEDVQDIEHIKEFLEEEKEDE